MTQPESQQRLTNHLKESILKAEWIMNSPCQLHCSYCAIAHRKIHEVSFEEKIKIMDKFKELSIFPVIYGGEATLSKDFPKVLSYFKKLGIPYAVISNGFVNLMDLRHWVKNLGLKNWSVSIDTLCFEWNDGQKAANSFYDQHALEKSRAGFATLVYTWGIVPDRVANITVTKHNYKEVPFIVERLSSMGVWSLFNLVNTYKEGFDFSAKAAAESMLTQKQLDEVAAELLYLRKMRGTLIHNSPDTFLMWAQNGLKQDWHCSKLSKFVIDCDGTVRCCVDWKGAEFGQLKFSDISSENFEEYRSKFLGDIWKCSGCAWSSTKDSEVFQSAKDGEKMLTHRK